MVIADASHYKDIYAFRANNAPLTSSIPGFQASVAYQPLSVSVIPAGTARGGNSLGLSTSQGTSTCITPPLPMLSSVVARIYWLIHAIEGLNFNYRWANTVDDATVKAIADIVISKATRLTKVRKLFNLYM